jgi:signal transduction histidine kinase
MWVANYMGLANIQGNKTTYYNEANGLPSNSLRKIFESTKGDIWLASRASGLIRFDPSGKHEVFDKNKGLLSNYVMAIDEDVAGNLIIGTNAGGLSILTSSGTIENYKIHQDDDGTIIFSLKAIGSKSAWLCTNLGLYLFRQGTIVNIPLEGLKTQKFFDFIDDERGNYWLTSGSGVIQLKRMDVEEFITGKRKDVPYLLLGEGDGMESEECTGATTSYLEKSTGHLWIPTFEGVAIIKPELKVQNNKIPRVVITGMQVDNNLITPIKNNLIIQPGNFRYLFDVTSLSFLAPSKVQFKYRLEGIEGKWNGPTRERRIEYTNLPFGTYTLQVIGSNNDGIWNMEGDQLSFQVEPYFFETIWFRIILGSLILCSLYALYRWRVKDIRRTNKELTKMNRELDRFVYSASHDLRGPLTSIMGVVDIATLDKNGGNHSEHLTMIRSSADKLDHFINGLINYTQNKNDEISKEKFHLATLISEIISELELLAKDQNISIEQLVSQEVIIKSDRDRLKIIIKNLLHNAIIFSKGKTNQPKIQIYCQNENEIIIKDNGVGISPKARDKIFEMFFRGSDLSKGSGLGLYIAREAGDKIQAKIEVSSQLEIGSEFKIILPFKALD